MCFVLFKLFLKTPNTKRRKKKAFLQDELIKLLVVCFVLVFFNTLGFRFSDTRGGKSFLFINLFFLFSFVCLSIL